MNYNRKRTFYKTTRIPNLSPVFNEQDTRLAVKTTKDKKVNKIKTT